MRQPVASLASAPNAARSRDTSLCGLQKSSSAGRFSICAARRALTSLPEARRDSGVRGRNPM
jgi:hypothetical protein